MRTAFLLVATLGLFGTGCGGCADDKNAPPPPPSTPALNASPRKISHVRIALDGGPSLNDPAPAADAGAAAP
jgi:hypothetical protein